MCNSPNLTDISNRDTNAALRPAVSFQDHPKQMLIQTSVQVSAFYSSAQSLSCFPAFISGQVSSRFIDKAMKLYVNGTTRCMDFWPLVFPKAPMRLLINVKQGKRDRGESLMMDMIYLKRNKVMPGNYDRILFSRRTRSLQKNSFYFSYKENYYNNIQQSKKPISFTVVMIISLKPFFYPWIKENRLHREEKRDHLNTDVQRKQSMQEPETNLLQIALS